MKQEATRESASDVHRAKYTEKLNVLLEQKKDLSQAIDFLLEEIEKGNVKMKTYK